MQLDFSILNEGSSIAHFDCGHAELNLFLKNFALLYQKRHFGVTMLCLDEANRVVGYYTLCPSSIKREELPEKFLTGPRPNPIPTYRLCRLAIDKFFQKKGYGQVVLVHSLFKCIDQAKQIGGSLVMRCKR